MMSNLGKYENRELFENDWIEEGVREEERCFILSFG